ncbi:MAG: hypothetical protein ACFFDT_26270 [Candidatus Hodarchaeota archaeon]
MRKRKLFIYCILLVTTPTLLACPQNPLPHFQVVHCQSEQSNLQENARSLTYDEVLLFLEEIESGEFEERCSLAQLEQVNQFIALLAKKGLLPGNFDEEMSVEEDIEDLLGIQENPFESAFSMGDYQEYMIVPAVFNGLNYDIIHCGWIKKKWKKTKKFVKKHKKALIIGTVVVVAVAAVTVAVVAASTASAASAVGAAAGAAASSTSSSSKSSGSNKSESKESASSIPNSPQPQTHSDDTPIFKSVMEEQISSFKENIARENFFQDFPGSQSLSLEETGRVVGPLFAHNSFNCFNDHLLNYPQFSQEIQNIASQHNFSFPTAASNNPIDFGRNEIDRRFSSNCGSMFADSVQEVNFNTLFYQMRGEKALDFGYYNQSVSDLGKAIDMNPMGSILYLDRSEAHFKLGNYDKCFEDFHTFTQQTVQEPKKHPVNVPDFSIGFAKGLPKGMLESGHGILLLCSDIVLHPIHTGKQMWDSLKLLSNLACSKEWGILAEVLAPEVHQLIIQWDTLPSDIKGELAGHAFGKYGADIIIPGALAKAVSKGMRGGAGTKRN